MFPECFKEVSRKLSRCLKKFHVAWHSSQLPEQKESLFLLKSNIKTKTILMGFDTSEIDWI